MYKRQLVMADMYASGTEGAALTAQSFEAFLPGVGDYVVAITLLVFIFSTILGWGYFGEKCFTYLVGSKFTMLYRFVFVIAIIPGATMSLSTVWNLGDVFNALMAVPNLIGLVLLSGVVVAETKVFLDIRKKEKEQGIN